MSDRWRDLERTITDFVHRRCGGAHIVDVCGRPHIAAVFFDDGDGRVLEQQLVVDIEALARAIEDNT
jgi:hypothetical protein